MSKAGVTIANPDAVIRILCEHNGELSFSDLLTVLREHGFSDSASRDLIWRLLAHGVIQFTSDRDRILLARDRKVAR